MAGHAGRARQGGGRALTWLANLVNPVSAVAGGAQSVASVIALFK